MPKRVYALITGPTGGPKEHRFNQGDILTADESRRLAEHLVPFEALRDAYSLLPNVSANLADFLRADERLRTLLQTRQVSIRDRAVGFAELNRTFANYLSSIRTYRDHTRARLNRVYGRATPVVAAFDADWDEAYRSDFAFGFTWEFRNYVQHCGMPFDVARTSLVRSEETVVEVGIQRDVLLKRYRKWQWLEPKIRELPSTIDPKRFLQRTLTRLEALRALLWESEKGLLTEHGQALITLTLSGFANGGFPAVVEVGAGGDPTGMTDVQLLDVDPLVELGLVSTYESEVGPRTVVRPKTA